MVWGLHAGQNSIVVAIRMLAGQFDLIYAILQGVSTIKFQPGLIKLWFHLNVLKRDCTKPPKHLSVCFAAVTSSRCVCQWHDRIWDS